MLPGLWDPFWAGLLAKMLATAAIVVAVSALTWPVAGWNRVRILVVPPRMYSCGWVAGWPRGRHDTPGCGTAWKGPASSSHQTESPSCAPSV